MKRYTSEVLVTYDSDEAGTKAALRAIPILRDAGLQVRIINMKPYKDPDEFIKALGTEAFQQRIEEAQSSFLFEIEVLERGYNLKDPAQKTAFFDETARKLLNFSDELERNNYTEAVAAIPGARLRDAPPEGESAGDDSGRDSSPAASKGCFRTEKGAGRGNGRFAEASFDLYDFRPRSISAIIRRYIAPEDFTKPLYSQIAEMLYEQQDQGKLNPAGILSRFENAEEQREAASVFNAVLKKVETKEELSRHSGKRYIRSGRIL